MEEHKSRHIGKRLLIIAVVLMMVLAPTAIMWYYQQQRVNKLHQQNDALQSQLSQAQQLAPNDTSPQ